MPLCLLILPSFPHSTKGLIADVSADASDDQSLSFQNTAAGSVLIVGIGAVGGSLALQLARLGLRLRLMDKGVFGSNNFAWYQLGHEVLGQPKASLADLIRQRLPGCVAEGFVADITTLNVETLREHLGWADVVVAATDDPTTQAVINRECLLAGTPVVFPGVWVDPISGISEAGEILWVDPRRGNMPCYECASLFRNQPGDAQAGRDGVSNIEALVQATTTVVRGLLEPNSPAARFIDPARSFILVRGLEPVRWTLREVFLEDEFIRHERIEFPPRPCPACGQSVPPNEPPPDTASADEILGGPILPAGRPVPHMGHARNRPFDQSDNHPTDRRARAAAAVTVIVIVAFVIVWAVTSAVNRHHAAATAVPSGPISPTVKLVCDPHVGGTWCEDGASGSAGTIALDIVGVSYDNFYNLCGVGYKFDLTDNYGQSSGVTGNGCGGYGDVYSTSANPVTGAPYIDLKLPKYPNTDNYRCGPWALTLRIKDPSGQTIRTARYGTNLNTNCPHPMPSPSTGATSAPSIRAKTASVRVSADAEGGVKTDIYVRKGDKIVITASGSVGYGFDGDPCAGYPTTHPDGSRYLGSSSCVPKYDSGAVLPTAPIGELIAKIGDGAWFGVGTRTTTTADGSGYIYLAYNDSEYYDNTGSYSATITNKGTSPLTSP